VDEHTEAGLAPPFHALVVGHWGIVFSRGIAGEKECEGEEDEDWFKGFHGYEVG
jgi:hypothetical protein